MAKKKAEVEETTSPALQIRALYANEIECRVGTLKANGLSILLYKDARVDMRLLDEVYGPMNWKREHYSIDGKLFCTISVWDNDKKEWVSKSDVGTESNTEKTKGESSDSFKRAGFCWGIGRELYTAPFIWIKPIKDGEIYKGMNGSNRCDTKFHVDTIEYNDKKEIIKVIIKDENGVQRWPSSYKNSGKASTASKPAAPQPTTVQSIDLQEELNEAIEDINLSTSRKEFEAACMRHRNLESNAQYFAACIEKAKEFPKPKK